MAPGRQLFELILAAVAIGGLIYGIYWKRQVTSSSKLEVDDQLLFDLYGKLERLEKRNEELLVRVQELETADKPKP